MNVQTLIAGLQHTDPQARLQAARVLGMVEEVEALTAVGAAYKVEMEPLVRDTLQWAGQRIYKVKQNGVNLLDVVFEHFRIAAELESLPLPEEREMVRQLEEQFQSELLSMQQRATRSQMGWSVAAGGMLGGIAGMASGMVGSLNTSNQVGAASSSFGGESREVKRRTPATMPTDADIRIWTTRLQTDPDAKMRLTACRELLQLNNPHALFVLATAYLTDPDTEVQGVAQQCGRELYLRWRYWLWAEDGTIDTEYLWRAELMGRVVDEDLLSKKIPPEEREDIKPASAEEIADILRRAEESRAKRVKRR